MKLTAHWSLPLTLVQRAGRPFILDADGEQVCVLNQPLTAQNARDIVVRINAAGAGQTLPKLAGAWDVPMVVTKGSGKAIVRGFGDQVMFYVYAPFTYEHALDIVANINEVTP